jgi:putative PIN family toxin of toxin-antitoxin system
MIGVVIDTNVVISAAFRDRTPEEIILFIIDNDEFEWIVSTEILKEYNEVLARKKFDLPAEVLEEWRETFQQFTTPIEPDVEIEFPRDQKDAKFLECSLASNANYLITGDRDFEEAQKMDGTTIISASRFKRLIMKSWAKE